MSQTHHSRSKNGSVATISLCKGRNSFYNYLKPAVQNGVFWQNHQIFGEINYLLAKLNCIKQPKDIDFTHFRQTEHLFKHILNKIHAY